MPYNQQAMIDHIPLYLNGSLNDSEKQEFEEALKHDLELADEYALMASVNAEFEHHAVPDSDALFAGITNNIDQLETENKSPINEGNSKSWFDTLITTLMAPQIAWGFAIIAVVVSFVVPVTQSPTDNVEHFQTLSLGENQNAKIGDQLNVIFAPDSSYQEITAILKSINAQIVKGPNPMGLIVISVKDGQQAISILKNTSSISFVESKL